MRLTGPISHWRSYGEICYVSTLTGLFGITEKKSLLGKKIYKNKKTFRFCWGLVFVPPRLPDYTDYSSPLLHKSQITSQRSSRIIAATIADVDCGLTNLTMSTSSRLSHARARTAYTLRHNPHTLTASYTCSLCRVCYLQMSKYNIIAPTLTHRRQNKQSHIITTWRRIRTVEFVQLGFQRRQKTTSRHFPVTGGWINCCIMDKPSVDN